ncbi:U-box domain-containing protein 5 [Durio zibethinus]|uniref:RING-type E3 ubiquitin transferase n=1 Tax=Durio zibethinus TaxID=66656 RepID=A0A6P5YJ69_DURZI|nr:U-box domain-containing protein 5 [Durio zibethinus]XP_022740553.1 U-box domain-containing protein 5 [Durio zibethinus]
MGTDAAEVVETPSYPSSFKVHHMMCTELRKLVDRIIRIFPEIEAARPRCSSGIKALCSLNSAIERAKLLLQYCSESSKLYLAITADVIVSRFQKSKNLLEQGLCQIQTMVPVMLAVEISQLVDDLRAANFVPDKFEEEAGKVVKELLQRGAAGSDSMEYAEMKAIQTAASRLHITSSTAILIEKRSIKKLLEKVSDTDQQKKKILKYLLYLLRKYATLIICEQTDNTTDQNEGAFAVNDSSTNFMHAHSVDVGSHLEYKRYAAEDDKLSRAIPPEEFKCPISSRLMCDPVVIASGQTFERIWIQKWFDDGNDMCPKTKMKLAHLSLTPNAVMKDLISKWCIKNGVTLQYPGMQPDDLQLLETSSTSITSFGSSINDLHFPVDISSISLRSLDTSYTSDVSRNKIADVPSLIPEQNDDDLCQYQSPSNGSGMDLESLSSLAKLDWDSKCKMVEDIKTHLECDDLVCPSMSSNNSIEPLINFLSSAHDLHDIRAERAGLQLLLTFLSKSRSGMRYLNEDAYSLFSLFLDSEVTKEVLDIIEVLSGHSSCRSKIAASGALPSILNILDSKITEFQERVIKILGNLSSSTDVCSTLVYLECIPKFVPFLQDTTLARHCILVLRNLCCNQEARASITQTSGCISSIAMLLETDSYEDQEHALAILLALCSQRVEYCHLVMDKCDNIFPALFDVSVNGSEKGKASALELLRLLRDTNCGDYEQECFQSDNVTSEDANYSKDKKSHKSLFGVKLPMFSRSSALKKKK